MEQVEIFFSIQEKKAIVEEGTLLSKAIRENGILFAFPCGGNGSCGKCGVKVSTGGKNFQVSACQYRVTVPITAEVPEIKAGQMLTLGVGRKREWRARWRTDAEDGQRWAAAAFDIGTTSVAGYLLDSGDGRTLAVRSRYNPQRVYGADVISRAIHEAKTQDGVQRRMIQKVLDEMLGDMAEEVNIKKDRICQIMLVGNTCMHHLFLGISPVSLIKIPYHAAMTEAYEGMAADHGIHIAPDARLRFLPNLAGFVGADTVGCLLNIDFLHEKKKTLMIDIGTNGELVMGTMDKAYTCSTAAGPALEGAKISCGMCASEGAIQHLTVENGEFRLSVIGDVPPSGICGSGLIDAAAVFLRTGLIDVRGRIRKPEKLKTEAAKRNAWRIDRGNGMTKIRLTDRIFVTQQDIREIQLAKSAIAAGIQILCEKLGWTVLDLEQILVAGAFGNYMDTENACEIGLFPRACRDRIVGIGNAAGEGAKLALSDEACWAQAKELTRHVEFVELASEPDFQNRFVQNLNFNT